jgi:hypothetical protein
MYLLHSNEQPVTHEVFVSACFSVGVLKKVSRENMNAAQGKLRHTVLLLACIWATYRWLLE